MFFKQKRIYADAGAATPLSKRSKDELMRLLPLFGNAGALHKEAVEAKKELEAARKKIADAIGAHADEIVFTASGTEGNNLALHGFKRVLTSAIEHQSVLEPLRNVIKIPVDKNGVVDLQVLKDSITPDIELVSLQLANSEIGTIEPVREVSKLLRKQGHKVLLHTDASQAPLWMDIKVERLGVDLMTLDAQKVLGPKGVGCLYIKRGITIEPLLRGGKQEQGLRGGTENVPLIGAFAVALEDAQTNIEERVERVTKIRDELWLEIKRLIPNAIQNSPEGSLCLANNLNISVPGLNAEMAVVAMDAEGVALSTRSACEVGKDEPSHVLQALASAQGRPASGGIRITLLPDATSSDAKRIAKTLQKIAKRYGNVV